MVVTNSVNVKDEYGKNKELKKDDVEILQQWIAKQPHLPNVTELELVLFLHSCYYRIEATKACIETFYTVKTHCPEFFKNRDPIANSSEILYIPLFVPLPRWTPTGNQVIFAKLLTSKPDGYSLASHIKCFDMSVMLMLHQLGTAPGQIILADLKEFTFSHFTKLNPIQLKKFFVYLQEGLPVRLLGLYFINIPGFMDKLLSLAKPFMKKELWDSLQLFNDKYEGLYKLIPQECLPADYGGTAASLTELTRERNENFEANANFFVDGEAAITDESRRVGKAKNATDTFGVEGTFKKLAID